jgi:hypothetical protein
VMRKWYKPIRNRRGSGIARTAVMRGARNNSAIAQPPKGQTQPLVPENSCMQL